MILDKRYREIILYKVLADLSSEASRTYLSFLWWIIDPVLSMSVLYIVFGVLLSRGTKDYIPFLLIGTTIWQWFANTIIHGMDSINGNRALMEQVYLPKAIFPTVVILMDAFKFLIIFLLILIFLWIYGFNIGVSYLALPVLFFVQFVLVVSCTYFLAALVPFAPDLKFLVHTFLSLMFFLSGVFFEPSTISERHTLYFYLNPMVNLIEDYRNILMYNKWPDFRALAIIFSISSCLVYISYRLIKKFDYIYPKAVI